jgi:hypothetical protein
VISLFILFLLYYHSTQKLKTPKQELDGAEKKVDLPNASSSPKPVDFMNFLSQMRVRSSSINTPLTISISIWLFATQGPSGIEGVLPENLGSNKHVIAIMVQKS